MSPVLWATAACLDLLTVIDFWAQYGLFMGRMSTMERQGVWGVPGKRMACSGRLQFPILCYFGLRLAHSSRLLGSPRTDSIEGLDR